MRVAFVHDYLTQFGGAERVLLELLPLYPDAPLYTSVFDPRAVEGRFAGADVRTTFLQALPGATRHFRALLPLYPSAFESLDLTGFDLVISSTTSFAKGVRVAPGALHVCYIHTPTRFLWYPGEYTGELTPPLARPALSALLPWLRRWDRRAAQRPAHLIANSHNVAQRVLEIYGRRSDVVHCPVDAAAFASDGVQPPDEYFLVMSRLLPYKRIALAIEACALIAQRLVVVGSGPDERRLRAVAGPLCEFAGRVSDQRRRELVARARAVIVPGEEDFGLVALEAAAAGRPTVAFAAGGALETVVEGETGLFFREPNPRALAQSLQALAMQRFDSARMQMHARRFAPDAFRQQFAALIQRYLRESRRQEPTTT